MMHRTTQLIVFVSVLVALVSAEQSPTPSRLFHGAVTLMEARGDCQAASPLFERVARGSDRALAARALVYLGLCAERLGRDTAAATYERVIKEYPEQRASVAQARRRLSTMARPRATATEEPTLRRAWRSVPADFFRAGAVSPGGRVFAYANRDGQVALGDLTSGQPLEALASGTGGTIGQRPVPSADGTGIVFTWQPRDGGPVELRMARRGLRAPVVLHRASPGESLLVQDWRAGRLLLEVTAPSGAVALCVLTDTERSVRNLTRLEAPALSAKLSPDGELAAYDAPEADGGARDVVVRATADGAERLRIDGPSDDFAPAWSPAGDSLLFVSSRLGSPSLWRMPVGGPGSRGQAELLQRDLGVVINVLAVTDEGALYYVRETGLSDVAVQRLDGMGRPVGEATRATAAEVGGNQYPTFASDGRSLTFVSQISSAQVADYVRLAHYSLMTGRLESLRTDLSYQVLTPVWSPDGRMLLVQGGKGGRYGYFRVDPISGSSTPVLTFPFNEDRTVGGARWLRNSQAFLYVRRLSAHGAVVRRFDLATGLDDVWATFDGVTRMYDLAVSRRDDSVATAIMRDTRGSLLVRKGTEPWRELISFGRDDAVLSVAWMPDGETLLFSQQRRGEPLAALWRVAAAGGEAESLGVAAHSMRDLSVSPDGGAVAWTTGQPARMPWVLEHVLPARRR